MSQHYQTRRLITEEGNLSRPICTSHNLHTHTGNTRQSEPQLKDSLCSSAIPSHNSRDVIPSHNSRNATCLPSILSHNSRNIPASRPLRYHPKPCRPRTSKAFKYFVSSLLPETALELPGKILFHTAWRNSSAARRFVPLMPLTLQLSSSGTTLITSATHHNSPME